MQLSHTSTNQHIGTTERRTYERFPCNRPALMTTPLGLFAIHILDVAKDGFGLRVPKFLPPGARVKIHLPYSVAEAEVRYCIQVGSEFGAGVYVRRIVSKSGGKRGKTGRGENGTYPFFN
jgi:predicted dehydrogenase